MIELHLLLHMPRQQTRPVIAAFRSLAKHVRAEPGCRSARLFVAAENPRCLCYVETWASDEDVRRMIRSPHFSQLAALMELASEAPECEFRVIAETHGLEFPARVRDRPDALAETAMPPERLRRRIPRNDRLFLFGAGRSLPPIHIDKDNDSMMNPRFPRRPALLALLIGAALIPAGCSLPVRQHAVPKAWSEKAEIPGLPGVRYVIRAEMPEIVEETLDSIKKEQAWLAQQGLPPGSTLPPAHFLALSGGGDDGAFGAGLLSGWTRSGTRPEFKMVTGISTGALIAPFAFLGPKYDEPLKAVYTQTSPKDILEARGLLAAVFDDALADNAPLGRLAEKYVTREMLQAIAGEYAKGRLLLMATTNLDARQAVIWNMTKIAASGHPKALELFHKIMLASAAIPGAFPPAMIDVEANGQRYQEMHVDGGAMAQVFVYPPSIKVAETAKQAGIVRDRHLYVIRNARLDPEWAEVERQTLSIAGRAISSLIQTQGVGDLYKIYAEAQRDGFDYNLAYIPKTFQAPHQEDFDSDYMRKLYQTGYDLAVKGYRWQKTPPGL
jgi:predicted acylesterase/phospholipase RssA/quinol monooxygenase YgiN